MKVISRIFGRHRAGNIILVFVVVQLALIVTSLIIPHTFAYLSLSNVQTLLKSMPLAIIAMAVGLLMIAGEFDLSVGSNFALTAFVMAMVFNRGANPVVAALVSLAFGAFIGFINGLIVIKAKIPSFIATLGAMMFWRGILRVISGGQTQSFGPGGFFESIFSGALFGYVQAQFLWAIVVGVLCYALLERHRLGNHIFAVGGNKESAIAIGVNPNAVKMVCFILVGVLTAFAGILSTTRVGNVSPDQGAGYELQAIAACVVGGVSLAGGEGTILGIFLGAALLFTMQDVLLLLRFPGDYLDMFVGILIVVAVIFNRLSKKERD
jgi:ribose/xylose/arabinose/galactoside ABC-type transport system permease subunit